MWQRPELWFKPFAKLPGERLSRESMLFLLWISRSTTKMPTADCQGQWAQSGRTEWASPRCPSELEHFCVVIFQHSSGKMAKIHPQGFGSFSLPSFYFSLLLLLFLWGLAGWCAYTKSIHWCSPYRYPHSPTSPHPHPHSAETLLWRVSICLCLSNGNWHKGPQTRQHLISRAK